MSPRFKLAAIASAIALGAGLGIAFAGPAAAATNEHICVVYTKVPSQEACAIAYPAIHGPVNMDYDIQASPPWDTPSVFGEISVPNYNLCMQFHTNNTIWLNTCTGVSSEEWTAQAGAAKGTTIWFSAYNTSYCLNANPSAKTVNVAKCSTARNNVNQEWHQTSPG
jgi:hypothetical protein